MLNRSTSSWAGNSACESSPQRPALVPLADRPQGPGHLAAQLLRRLRHRAAVLPQHPRREQRKAGVLGREDPVVDLRPEGALDPPRGVARDLDPCLADRLADLPRRAPAVAVDVELRRQPKVTLAAGSEADLAPDARDAEGALVVRVEVLPDHVPRSRVLEERERVDGPLAFLVARDRPVGELDRAL